MALINLDELCELKTYVHSTHSYFAVHTESRDFDIFKEYGNKICCWSNILDVMKMVHEVEAFNIMLTANRLLERVKL